MGCCAGTNNHNEEESQINGLQKSRNNPPKNINQSYQLNANGNDNCLFIETELYSTVNPELTGSLREMAQTMPDKAIYFKIMASSTEITLPIWIEKNDVISFKIKGKWNCLDDIPDFNCEGTNIEIEELPHDINLGALCGYVLGGEIFSFKKNFTYISDCSGPLVLFQNNGSYLVNPTGSLHCFVSGGSPMPIIEIENKLGWEVSRIDNCSAETYMNDNEKQMIYIINKVRSNPKLFAELYLKNQRHLSEAHSEAYSAISNLEPVQLLKTNKDMYSLTKNQTDDMGKYGKTGHLSITGEDLDQRFLSKNIPTNSIPFGENCSYGLSDPMSIVIQLIIDEGNPGKGHRHNIINPDFNSISVAISPHTSYGVNCVQNFAKL